MVKVFEGTEHEYYMDGYLQSNLDSGKKAIKQDWDMIFACDGYEGVGKSVFVQQVSFYCDPAEKVCDCNWKKPTPHKGLCISRIVFNPEDFKKAVLAADKYQAIIYDEAYGGLSSRSAMSGVNRSIVQMLTVIRAKNLFIFIVLPSFYDLDKYIALWRSRALMNCYSPGDFERGFFSFYGREEKKNMYVIGKQHYNYAIGKPNFRGRFTNRYLVSEEQYRDKKKGTSITDDSRAHLGSIELGKKLKKTIALNLRTKDLGLSNKQIAAIIGISRMTVHTYFHEGDESEGKDENEDDSGSLSSLGGHTPTL